MLPNSKHFGNFLLFINSMKLADICFQKIYHYCFLLLLLGASKAFFFGGGLSKNVGHYGWPVKKYFHMTLAKNTKNH